MIKNRSIIANLKKLTIIDPFFKAFLLNKFKARVRILYVVPKYY